MTGGPDHFRREALDHRDPGAEGDDSVPLATPWLRWVSWLLVVALAAGLALALTVRVEVDGAGRSSRLIEVLVRPLTGGGGEGAREGR
ncbi:MAG: hypothetical protein ACRDZ7_13860 [Acidimicrobiia bacterium]